MTEQKFPYRPFRIIENTPLALETFRLTLAPEDGEPLFSFQAGQWVGVKLPQDPILSRRNRPFSIATAPVESTHACEFAVKIYGDFTRLLQALGPEDRVMIQGPFGRFTLPDPLPARLVFLAGGIGIAPLRSMLRQVLLTNDTCDVVLFYSNRTPDRTAFGDEFRALATEKKNFHPIFLFTGEADEGWEGELGHLNRVIFDRYVPIVTNTEFSMCGPLPFMDTVTRILSDCGVDVTKKLHRELFG